MNESEFECNEEIVEYCREVYEELEQECYEKCRCVDCMCYEECVMRLEEYVDNICYDLKREGVI